MDILLRGTSTYRRRQSTQRRYFKSVRPVILMEDKVLEFFSKQLVDLESELLVFPVVFYLKNVSGAS